MRPARPATDAEVLAALRDDPSSVYQSNTDDWHRQVYAADHGAGDAPKAYWSGGKIIVDPGYPLPSR